MKCPDCGAEIAEGHLYCERCGMEIQIVPDFEPEIENSITETLSTVGEEIEDNRSAQKDRNEGVKEQKRLISFWDKRQNKNGFLATVITFFAVIAITIFAAVYLYHRNSVNYQVNQARVCAQAGDYEKAISYLEKAKKLKSNVAEVIFLQSNYYYKMGEMQKASDVLINLIARGQLEPDEKEKAYENIIAIWDEEGKYEEINELLFACEDSAISNQFQQYMAMTPEFGYLSGSYNEVVLLKMSANTTGKIYYTLDGSNPNENSMVYTAPLILESGEYQVAALFVNDYGIKSEVARSWYVINLTVPEPPELLIYSGSYQVPTMIEVAVPETGTVYYTMDGSNPTRDSLKYTEPVAMPLGRSNFKFVTISEEGVSSEIVSRSFDFTLNTDVTVSRAIDNVMQALFDRHVLSDLHGHSYEIKGKYVLKYNTIVEIQNLGYYYVLDEFIDSEDGTQTRTERMYAVEVYTGAPNRLVYDEYGNMGLISLQ